MCSVSQNCKDLHNYHASYAIVAGLNNAAIQRLKEAWEVLESCMSVCVISLCLLSFVAFLGVSNYFEFRSFSNHSLSELEKKPLRDSALSKCCTTTGSVFHTVMNPNASFLLSGPITSIFEK